MRQVVRMTVRGSDYEQIRAAAETKLKMLLGEDATLPYDAEFDISEGTEIVGDGKTVEIDWNADVTIRTSDASFQTT